MNSFVAAFFAFFGIGLIAFAAFDFVAAQFFRFDVWGAIGIELPSFVWSYSAVIVGVCGGGLIALANAIGEAEDEESESEDDQQG